jgi:hypothetical protein
MDRDEAQKKVREAADAGRVEFAEEINPNEFPAEFMDEFFREILVKDWDSVWFISHESSCLDFVAGDNARDVVLRRLEGRYHIDCSDMPYLNLYRVMRRAYSTQRR